MKNTFFFIIIILSSCKATKPKNSFEIILNKNTCIPSCGTYNVSLNDDGNLINFISPNNEKIYEKILNKDDAEKLREYAKTYEKSNEKNIMNTKDFTTYNVMIGGSHIISDTLQTIYPPDQELLMFFNELIKKYSE